MKYYSEDDVMDLIREAEDCERAYEWGEGHKRIHFEDYHSIEIPNEHGRLIDADALCNKLKSPDFAYFSVAKFESIIDEAETIVEATE